MIASTATSTTAPAAPSLPARNPGPAGGLAHLSRIDRAIPEFVFLPLRALGVAIATFCMQDRAHHSRTYLRAVLEREPSWRDIFRHFFEFTEALLRKLRVAEGRPHRGVMAPGADDFLATMRSSAPALFGTFHIADSDLTGYLIGGQEKRRIALIRQRVGNSHDTESLAARFGDHVSFIWVNETDNLLFALKDALASGCSIAMKCDRIAFSAKTEVFDFLGAPRRFPFTIYHLALIFDLPVLLTVGVPGDEDETIVHSSPLWRADPALSRAANLARARLHFQMFLGHLETLLRTCPYWWFNFIELNPEEPSAATST